MVQMLSTRPLADIPPFNNVQNEIFDMVKPAISEHITLKDLINWFVCLFVFEWIHRNSWEWSVFSAQGGLVLSILIDIGSFWTYEVWERSCLVLFEYLLF